MATYYELRKKIIEKVDECIKTNPATNVTKTSKSIKGIPTK